MVSKAWRYYWERHRDLLFGAGCLGRGKNGVYLTGCGRGCRGGGGGGRASTGGG